MQKSCLCYPKWAHSDGIGGEKKAQHTRTHLDHLVEAQGFWGLCKKTEFSLHEDTSCINRQILGWLPPALHVKEVVLALTCCWNCLYKGTWHQGDVATVPQVIGSCLRDNTSDSRARIHLWVNKTLLSSCQCDHTSKLRELLWKYLLQCLLLSLF